MGSITQPIPLEVELQLLSSEALQQANEILQQIDGEQQRSTALPEEDVLQLQGDEQPNYQDIDSAMLTFAKSWKAPHQQLYINEELIYRTPQIHRQQQSEFVQDQMIQVLAKDQMGEELLEQNAEVIYGLKYVVGSNGWGKQPINAYINGQQFPDRIFQLQINEGQTVLRQAQNYPPELSPGLPHEMNLQVSQILNYL
ncbi:MAG: hypothetical protein EZS28_050985, partial [Streblomastix strix]